jgi:hypothetical protein
LEELVLIDVSLNAQKVYYRRNMLIELAEPEIRFRTLDLWTCMAAISAVQLLGENLVNVQVP